MKSVFIIDTPKICGECRFKQGNLNPADELVWLCSLNDEHIEYDKKSEWCPLRPLPEKAAVDESMLGIGFDDFNTIYYLGFNECIDKITGETNDR